MEVRSDISGIDLLKCGDNQSVSTIKMGVGRAPGQVL